MSLKTLSAYRYMFDPIISTQTTRYDLKSVKPKQKICPEEINNYFLTYIPT